MSGDPWGEQWPWAGLAFSIISWRCKGEEEEPVFEVGCFGAGTGDAFLLPSSYSEVASSKVLKTEQARGAAPVGHPWHCLGRGSTM